MLIIDRIENNIAVCEQEDKTMINIPKYKLPLDVKAGDCLGVDNKGSYILLEQETKNRKTMIEERFKKLYK